ncbi:biotin--protein ligase-like isoform X1 [Ptychodera flava]|uniref:biotin--protein ligase-like isoform X1 n=2 Tax=Ptychodera flava TaxID=63121 RepID=UPI00396A92B7
MFITICYAYLTLVWYRRHYSQKMHIVNLVRQRALRCSVVFRKPKALQSRKKLNQNKYSVLCEPSKEPIREEMEYDFPSKQLLTVTPMQAVNLNEDWTSFIGSEIPLDDPNKNHTLILIEAHLPRKGKHGRRPSLDIPDEKSVKLSELSVPIAWKAGQPFGLLVRSRIEDFSTIGLAFLDGLLQLDDGLQVEQMLSVGIVGNAFKLLDYLPGTRRSCTLSGSKSHSKSRSQNSISAAKELHRRQRPRSFGGEFSPPSYSASPSSSPSSLSPQSGGQPRHLRKRHSPIFLKKMEEKQRSQESSPLSSTFSSRRGSQESVSSGIEITIDNSLDSPGPMETSTVATSNKDAINEAAEKHRQKPPNALVLVDNPDEGSKFNKVKALLDVCLQRNCYTTYSVDIDTVLKDPWIDNTQLLILATNHDLSDHAREVIMKYLYKGGRLLSLCGSFHAGVKLQQIEDTLSVREVRYSSLDGNVTHNLHASCTKCSYKLSAVNNHDVRILASCHDNAILVHVSIGDHGGAAILSQVHLEDTAGDDSAVDTETFTRLKKSNMIRHEVCRDVLTTLGMRCGAGELPALTPCYLLCQNEGLKQELLASISYKLDADRRLKGSKVNLIFVPAPQDAQAVTSDQLPVVTDEGADSGESFNKQVYMQNLKTNQLGKVVFYSEVIPTTQLIFESLQRSVPTNLGLVAIATAMTAGKGRGGNTWLGPPGCAMFSLLAHFTQHSQLGQRLPYLQHIASLAVVDAVRLLPGYEKIDLRLKWPNDIYYGNEMKLGGVIVNTSYMAGQFTAVIGCGFNVNNSDPTICINDIIQQYNREHGTDLAKLTVEEQIARTITQMEFLLDDFILRGKDPFRERYYQRWLHSGVRVRLENESGPEVCVVGLDDNGFLLVKDSSGNTQSVQPDGNSFDMTKNLISLKTR